MHVSHYVSIHIYDIYIGNDFYSRLIDVRHINNNNLRNVVKFVIKK